LVAVTVAAIDDAVRVHTGRLTVERLGSELSGDRPACPEGGGTPSQSFLLLDLDSSDVSYWYPPDELALSTEDFLTEMENGNVDYNGFVKRPFALDIVPEKSERILISASSNECYCRWHLDLEIDVAGTRFTHQIDDRGEPFLIAPQQGNYDDYLYDVALRAWCPYSGC
jgi:hypothetical protein